MNSLSKIFLVSTLCLLVGSAFAASETGYSTAGNPSHPPVIDKSTPAKFAPVPANTSSQGYHTSKNATNNASTSNHGYSTSHSSGSVSNGGYTTHSTGTVTNRVVSNHGYSTQGNPHDAHHSRTYRSAPQFSFNIGTTGFSAGYYTDGPEDFIVVDHYEDLPTWPRWYSSAYGVALPANAVVGGQDPYSGNLNFVCRADYQAAIYPGRLVDGKCHFATNGIEIAASEYQVLVSPFPLRWVASSFGHVPNHAIYGGRTANGQALYVCQTTYKGINVPGRISGRACKIGIDGLEINKNHYHVLAG